MEFTSTRNNALRVSAAQAIVQGLSEEGGLFVPTSFPKLDVPVDIHTFCENLLKDEGVLLVPGDAFDTPGHARLGYCAPEATLRECLKRLSKYMHQYD